jgi:hypothetical protein
VVLLRDAAASEVDIEAAAIELPLLRSEEQDTIWRNPADNATGSALGLAVDTLTAQLWRAGRLEEVCEAPASYHIVLAGPSCEQYFQNLKKLAPEHVDTQRRMPTRRLVRLLTEDSSDAAIVTHDMLRGPYSLLTDLIELYSDPAGRLVAELMPGSVGRPRRLAVEWPTATPTSWTPDTVIAADKKSPKPASLR